ncbi:hypothetical protein JOD54_006556 [Actinokineospora baliensis]|uniref:neutral zinc metallopeptidase n=1 Tax=Actinokineospora baliensis TaxID=547056 RepID=UPI001959F459|nr:neutral zinc metallopeptidase [Actinokineospora baliensis]MBM7776352.1 hypothetical protein [Actinokineospora baliensis]
MVGQQPYFGTPVDDTGVPPRNRPLVLFTVLGGLLVGVLWIAIIGKVTSSGSREIAGTAYAVGEQQELSEPGTPGAISQNPLLVPGRELAATPCPLPALGTTAAELEVFYKEGLACLDRAWKPALEAAGKPVVTAKLSIADNPKSKCGFVPSADEALAFYCNRDRTIYMPRQRLMDSAGDSAPFHLAVLSHEYGHHMQALAGILSASSMQENAAEDAEAMKVSRRTELQANCFGGLFLDAAARGGSLKAEFVAEAVESFGDTLNSDSHGSQRNQAAWAERGKNGGSTASCDTWSATDLDVE